MLSKTDSYPLITIPASALFNIRYSVEAPLLKLNIGCGLASQVGYANCDLYSAPNVDYVFDCQERWPFDDNSAGIIYASHVIEHLPNPGRFFDEAWRVLHPKGTLAIRVPHCAHDYAWGSFQHVRAFSMMTFYGLMMGSTTGLDETVSHPWRIVELWRFIDGDGGWIMKWPWKPLFFNFAIKHFYGIVAEIGVIATK